MPLKVVHPVQMHQVAHLGPPHPPATPVSADSISSHSSTTTTEMIDDGDPEPHREDNKQNGGRVGGRLADWLIQGLIGSECTESHT